MTVRSLHACRRYFGVIVLILLSLSLTTAAEDGPVEAKKPAIGDAAKTVLLRYQFKPNQFLHYEVVHAMLVKMHAQDLVETTHNRTVSKQHLRVVSVNNAGGAVLEPTLDHVRMKSQFDDNPPTLFDSDDPNKQPPQFVRVLESVGKPQGHQRVDARGNIVQGDDTSESMRISPLLVTLPEEPVAVGASWSDDYSVNVRVREKIERPIKLRRTFTLSKLDGDVATIEFKTFELDPPHDPDIRVQLIQMTPSGEIHFDVSQGMIVQKTTKSDKREYNVANGVMHAVSERTEKLVTSKR